MFKKKRTLNSRNFDTILNKPSFSVVEAYKFLRTNILFSIPAEAGRAIRVMFTSATPGDGKTTVSVNTAIAFAQTGMRVLIIDADLRKPMVHRFFGVSSRNGLSNVLSGQSNVEDVIQRLEKIDNLCVIPSGIFPPNPSELLTGKYFDIMMEKLDKMFDVIIIDTPPTTIVSDALLLCKKVDGVVVVAASNKTFYPELQKTVKKLKFAEAKILGVVLNMVRVKLSGRNKAYNSYYGHKDI